ncbi:site-2 protease family protein [Granulicella sp. S190]|uniref:site-2 protease family protein n=1 Tax=Granulicella sp. S190 TaxID=1747226 RepID=UPI00131E3A14|nr:site-2 protease family protein [Granulicella sp. S190]
MPQSDVTATTSALTAPDPIHNCPECDLWLPPMTLSCPECHGIVYARHLKGLGQLAVSQEQEQAWPEARGTWQQVIQWLPADSEQVQVVAGHLAEIDSRIQAGEQRTATWKKRLGPLAPVAYFLLKAKTFLFALLKFKFLLSFFAFFGIYWALFGWRFGLGFAVSILIHEFGHYIAARRRGLKVDLPVFLPGLGAYVRWYSMGVSLDTLSSIALAGPFAGLLAAAACGAFYFETRVEVWAALAHAGAWLNLINLVPVLGLDGAQATHALNRTQRALLLAAAILFFAFLHEGVFLFIAAGMAWRLFTGVAPESPSSATMIRYTLLLFLLGALMFFVPETLRQF